MWCGEQRPSEGSCTGKDRKDPTPGWETQEGRDFRWSDLLRIDGVLPDHSDVPTSLPSNKVIPYCQRFTLDFCSSFVPSHHYRPLRVSPCRAPCRGSRRYAVGNVWEVSRFTDSWEEPILCGSHLPECGTGVVRSLDLDRPLIYWTDSWPSWDVPMGFFLVVLSRGPLVSPVFLVPDGRESWSPVS